MLEIRTAGDSPFICLHECSTSLSHLFRRTRVARIPRPSGGDSDEPERFLQTGTNNNGQVYGFVVFTNGGQVGRLI